MAASLSHLEGGRGIEGEGGDPVKLLVYFPAPLLRSRGTPSRARNLARFLARRPELETTLLSRDPSDRVASEVGAGHRRLTADASAALAEAVRALRPRVVWGHTHKSLAGLAALGAGGPWRVADLHGDAPAERWEQSWRPAHRRALGWLRQRGRELRYLRRMDAFTVVSERLAERVRPLGKPTLVLWGGVDPEVFAPPRPPVPAPPLRVAYAGNLRPYQGIETLIEAAARVLARDAGFHFELVGDAAPFAALAGRARDLLGGQVTFRGPVPYRDIPEVLGRAHVLVVPRPRSRTAEAGFPSKLPEYLALGLPVVATTVGEQARVIADGTHGLLVPPGSAEALAEALLRLRDPELRRRLGRAGRALAVERLSWERQAATLAEFFATLADIHE